MELRRYKLHYHGIEANFVSSQSKDNLQPIVTVLENNNNEVISTVKLVAGNSIVIVPANSIYNSITYNN